MEDERCRGGSMWVRNECRFAVIDLLLAGNDTRVGCAGMLPGTGSERCFAVGFVGSVCGDSRAGKIHYRCQGIADGEKRQSSKGFDTAKVSNSIKCRPFFLPGKSFRRPGKSRVADSDPWAAISRRSALFLFFQSRRIGPMLIDRFHSSESSSRKAIPPQSVKGRWHFCFWHFPDEKELATAEMRLKSTSNCQLPETCTSATHKNKL